MGSNRSKTKRPSFVEHPTFMIRPTSVRHPTRVEHPTPVRTKAAIVPILPQELIDEILDRLAPDSDRRSLQSCALVSRSWAPSCRRLLFHTVVFVTMGMERWLERFPVPQDSPAHLVKNLYVWIGASRFVPDPFFEYTPWFINLQSLSLMEYKGVPLLRRPSLWRSPQSVTSLTIKADLVTLVEIRDIMAELPNLNSLWLSGTLLGVDRRGVGTVLRGRFGGKLRLCNGYAGERVTNMLLEIPTGIHFTEIQIECPRKLLPSNIRLLEACGHTLVRLSYKVNFECKSRSPLACLALVRKSLTLVRLLTQMAGSLNDPSTSPNSQNCES